MGQSTKALVAGLLAGAALVAAACSGPPEPSHVPARPPGSLCAGFPTSGPIEIVCGEVASFSVGDLTAPGWRYVGDPNIRRVGDRRVEFEGVLLAPDETFTDVVGQYRFFLPGKVADLTWHEVDAGPTDAGRVLAFEGRTRYGTYHLDLSLRKVGQRGVQIRAHIDAQVRRPSRQ